MGMTIDEAIGVIEYYEEYGFITQCHAHEKAIRVMRKYQKIEKIVNNTFQNIAKEDERYAYEWLGDIKEVLEDRVQGRK